MLKDSQFSKDIEVAQKLLSDGNKLVQEIQNLISDEQKEAAVKKAIEYEVLSEKIVNNARIIPIDSGIPFIDEVVNENIIAENNVKIEYLNNNTWFHVKIPCLLTRKERGNPSFIRATLQVAFKEYFSKNPKVKITEDATIIFKHNYSKERKEREYRDHDNIELNSVVDIIALYVLLDDSALKLRHYYYSCIDDKDSTDIFIVPNKDFLCFLTEY